MNFNRIRDLVSNLGWSGENQAYVPGPECLGTLEKLEDELLNEDALSRNVRISLHICGAVRKDLIPIISFGKNAKMVATTTRVLVNLSLPIEYLLPCDESQLESKIQKVRKQLVHFALDMKKAFLDVQATLSLVTNLRESMIKSEKHLLPLSDEDCNHLKNCLHLLRNVLHLSEYNGILDETSLQMCSELQSVQSKLIWNLFVQGLDGALLLMLNSKYRTNWTVPLALIIALLYRNKSIGKVHQALELISSASESSEDDEESDGSKNSSASLSSEPSKNMDILSDSGCPEISLSVQSKRSNMRQFKCEPIDCTTSDIHTKVEKDQSSDDTSRNYQPNRSKGDRDSKLKVVSMHDSYESSSSCGSPFHKKMKGHFFPSNIISNESPKSDSAISMGSSSSDMMNKKSSDDDAFENMKLAKNVKVVQKLRCLQMNLKMSESDSSNEDDQGKKLKYRSHPPTGRRGKSPRRNNGCTPAICMDLAIEVSCTKGRVRYPLWEKRNSVSTLVDIHSPTPSADDIGNLLKEFTLSFMHSGFSQLVLDMKILFLEGQSFAIDKAIFFWIVHYFLHLSTTANICLDHISDILSTDVVSFLVFECVNACENMELHTQHNERMAQYFTVQLALIVLALKEVLCTVDLYSRKCSSPKDRVLFNELSGKLAGLQDLRHLPLLLFRNCPRMNTQNFLEDVVVLNHLILVITGRGIDHCQESNKINFVSHLRLFSTADIVHFYGRILENFKSNSQTLNDCVFTMMHHLAGDIRSFDLLIEPSILRIFSDILKEEFELEQYQEDLIMYILNKFSLQVYKKSLKEGKNEESRQRSSSGESSRNGCGSSNCLLSEDDDLFWWYLQFEQDMDPISRISEHISTSKQDILCKLQLKGHISPERHKQLEGKMEEGVPGKSTEMLPKEEPAQISNFDDDITNLLRTLVQRGERQHLIWLQNVLLETCYVKLGLITCLTEPVPFYFIKMMLSVPLIPYTEAQRIILLDEIFILLLEKLGFQLGSVHQMYPRIPLFWTPDMLFNIAGRLGPVQKDQLKFSYDELMLSNPNLDPVTAENIQSPALPPLSSCCTLSSWLNAVQQSKEICRSNQNNLIIFKPNS